MTDFTPTQDAIATLAAKIEFGEITTVDDAISWVVRRFPQIPGGGCYAVVCEAQKEAKVSLS